MSLETWKEEFYPIEAKDCPESEALQHSLQKWKGLRKDNLDKHGIELWFYSVEDYSEVITKSLEIDADSCALCAHYRKITVKVADCSRCPLFKERESSCDDPKGEYSPYSALHEVKVVNGEVVEDSNPEPMIKLIESAIKTSELSHP